ncbi:MAG: TatD family hydrolase [Bacteroidales bacterium]|nr:TatD family hydrolase [Bacteroidales bacterium]
MRRFSYLCIMLIDTHTHFYDEWLLPDAEEAVQRAVDAGVGKMIQADIDSTSRELMWEIGERHPGVLFQMLGLYPGSVGENWREELDKVFALAGKPAGPRRFVAIGEIGLDYHEGLEFAAQQQEAFRLQLELAAKLDLPVNIHLRDAWEDFFKIIEDCRHLHIRGNLHCFTASYEIYERANRHADFSVGIGGVLTFRNSRLSEAVARIPMEKILLETDAPYLAPEPFRGRRNESAYLPYVADRLAAVKSLSRARVEEITSANAQNLFGI